MLGIASNHSPSLTLSRNAMWRSAVATLAFGGSCSRAARVKAMSATVIISPPCARPFLLPCSEATRTAIVMALEAVTGIVLAAVFLGESVRPVVALGGAAVLAGAVIAALSTPASAEALESASPP